MTLSTDLGYLVLSGYGSTIPAGASLSTTLSSVINRVVGVVDYTGAVDTTTSLGDWANLGSPRSVASVDGSAFWLGSGVDGIRYSTLGSTTSGSISTTLLDVNQVGISNSQLYTSATVGGIRLGTVGVGLPTTAGQVISNLTGIPATGSNFGFMFFDLDGSVAGNDTLYFADDIAGLIYKYSLVGVTWTLNGSVSALDIRSMTGVQNGTSVEIYATSDDGLGNSYLYSYTDATGYNTAPGGVVTTLVSAGANTAFRCVAFAPLDPNQAPVNTVPVGQIINEDNNLVFSNIGLNPLSISDADAGVDSLQMTLSVGNGTFSLSGLTGLTFTTGDGTSDLSMTFTGSIADINNALNGLAYTPTLNYFGSDSFNMTVNDLGNNGSGGAKSDTDIVNITINAVNDPPVANTDNYSTNEDTQLVVNTLSGLLANDTDPDGPSMSVVSGTSPLTGSLSLNSDGSFTYTPLANYTGIDTFTYQISDGTNTSAFVTVTININPTNDAPINSLPARQTTSTDNPITLSSGNSNLLSVTDIDVASGVMSISLSSTNGTYTFASFAGLIFSLGDGIADSATTFTGTLANINSALNGLIFTPTASFTGTATLLISSNDQGNTGLGGALTDLDSLNIQVASPTSTPTPTSATSTPTLTPTSTPTPAIIINDPYILKTSNLGSPAVGQQVIFTLNATNPLTNSNANGVVVTDTLPGYFTIQSTTTSYGSSTVSGNTVTFNMGVMPAGFTTIMTITALVNSGAGNVTTNTATISGVDGGGFFVQQGSTTLSITGSNAVGPTTCSATPPGNVPDLFQIDTTNNSATLHFAPAGDPVSNYYISYGYNSSAEGFGTQFDQGFSSGAIKYTINLLNPGTNYYFKVRAGNGCQTGKFGNVLGVETTSSSKIKYSFDRSGNILGSRTTGGGTLIPTGYDLRLALAFATFVILSVTAIIGVKKEK